MVIALGVEYLGCRYSGWQRQTHSPSVQACVEQALSQVADSPIEVFCSGRTDAGVHAISQVIHFATEVVRPDKAWVLGGNAHLPVDISILWAKSMPADFHARYSANSRRYRYVIVNRRAKPAILSGLATWIRDELDEKRMHEAAQSLIGEQDFSSFRASSCQASTPFRNVFQVNVSRSGEFVIIDITANAFLHHMVRNIAGSLIEVGRGNYETGHITVLLGLKNRNEAAPTAAPDGLYFYQANYPVKYQIPQRESTLWLFD